MPIIRVKCADVPPVKAFQINFNPAFICLRPFFIKQASFLLAGLPCLATLATRGAKTHSKLSWKGRRFHFWSHSSFAALPPQRGFLS